jgi:hypothetical protein
MLMNNKHWLLRHTPEQRARIAKLRRLRKLFDSKIILRFTSFNHLNEQRTDAIEFLAVPVFSNYLRFEPTKAKLIGYNEKQYVRPVATTKVENITVCVSYKDGTERIEVEFEDVFKLATFLKENKELAESLQYDYKK